MTGNFLSWLFEDPYVRGLGLQFILARGAGDIPREMTFWRFADLRLRGADPYLNGTGDR
ncbi:MAG TPA: hypothetical protein VMV27_02045 [Candidatus Binataceae bacterium]|nr:hypothetical protein [Candidatus Binataceae bacterium]